MSDWVDRAMDRTVVPGYSRLGYWVRSRGWAGEPPPGALVGKSVAVAGANRGLGQAIATGLAELGATVHLVSRNAGWGRVAMADIGRAVPEAQLRLHTCDISLLADVRRFADEFAAEVPVLHGLVHNAGVLPRHRRETKRATKSCSPPTYSVHTC